MYEYTVETITLGTISGAIGNNIAKISNQKAKDGWKLHNTIIQYNKTGTNFYMYLIFERAVRTRFFRRSK